MRRILTAALALLSLSVAARAGQPAAADVVGEVPFTFEKGHMLVKALIKGDKPVEVAISTGAEHSTIHGSLLEKYGLRAYYTGEGVITGTSSDRVYTYTTVSGISVGGVKVASMNLRFGGGQSAWGISDRVGREIFAVLGADFFKGRVAQFDFEKKIVRFLRQTPPEALKAGASADRAVLRMTYREPVLMPIVEGVTFDGKKLKTLFDTGALTVVSLTPSAAKQLSLAAPPEKGGLLPEKVAMMRLGELEFPDLPVLIHAKGSTFERGAQGYAAVVGVALLQNFLVTFDFKESNIVLERR